MDFRTREKKPLRPKADDWLKMTAYPLANDVSLWETFDAKRDRVKLRHQCPDGGRSPVAAHGRGDFSPGRCRALQGKPSIEEPDGRFPPCTQRAQWVHGSSGAKLRGAAGEETKARGGRFRSGADARPTGGSRLRRGRSDVLYLALAGGSFAMTLVGLVVPGIPTVPFLLATSYFLARSSRWLDRETSRVGRSSVRS